MAGVPKVAATGQGGLLDVCLHPDFVRNRLLYLSYSGEGAGGNATTVARAEWATAACAPSRRSSRPCRARQAGCISARELPSTGPG